MLGPFANMNLLSNIAMAQGYDNYSDNNYDEYMYSEYPTDENKYECQTGPFEGFFVSSVEFCKFKFDKDRKDDRDRDNNQTGTQGSPGPQGETGATGPQGPQGPQGPAGGQIGPPGPPGAQGIQGLPGLIGATGAQGLQGLRGFNGTDGEDGAPGPRGFNGTQGPQGERGFNGTQGPPGNATADAELQCEECIKYWSHLLGSGDGFRDFIIDLTEAINSINFDYAPLSSPPPDFSGINCNTRPGDNTLVTGNNPDPNVRCLPQPPSGFEDLLAQVYELCEQFELAIEYIASENNISMTAAWTLFAIQFLNQLGGISCSTTDCKTARGLLVCLRDRVIPLLEQQQVEQQQVEQQQSPLILETISQEPVQQQQSPTIQQNNDLSMDLSQEEMQQEQLEKLKQFLALSR